jgi:predicted transcriptional regulator
VIAKRATSYPFIGRALPAPDRLCCQSCYGNISLTVTQRSGRVTRTCLTICKSKQAHKGNIVGTLTLRLPEQLDARLSLFAKQADSSRSELVRTALERFLRDMEREKLLAGMIKAAQFLATNPEARAESMAICAEFAVADSEALDLAEQGDAEPEKWWK